MNNLPPFYVGQKVVAIRTHSQGAFKEGQQFTIQSISKWICKCETWVVTVGIYGSHTIEQCACCGAKRYASTNEWRFAHDCFAPLQEKGFPIIQLTKVIEKEQQLVSAN